MVGSANDECSETARGELHQMDRDHAPSALDAELFEESGRDHSLAAGECVRVEQSSTDDGYEDDAEPSTKDLGRVSDDRSACHGSQIGNHLSHSHSIWRELELIFEHGWIKILRAMRHEVETCHQELQNLISMLVNGHQGIQEGA